MKKVILSLIAVLLSHFSWAADYSVCHANWDGDEVCKTVSDQQQAQTFLPEVYEAIEFSTDTSASKGTIIDEVKCAYDILPCYFDLLC